MRNDRLAVIGQAAVALAAATAAWLLLAPPLAVTGSSVLLAMGLGLSMLVLGFFNVWLPRGDVVDTTVPIAFAASIVLHPALACGVIVLARCAAVALRPRGQTTLGVTEQVTRRVLLSAGTYAALVTLFPRLVGGGVFALSGAHVAAIVGAAVLFIAADLLLEQVHAALRSGSPAPALVLAAVRLQGWMLAAEMSTAVLAVVLLPALPYETGLLITVGLLLVMRQSFALLLEVRASYTSTVEVLARSLEAYDPGRRGHAERVGEMVAAAGRLLGFQGKRLEDMTYAALFHDVGLIGLDELDGSARPSSAQVLSDVSFLSGAIPLLQVLDAEGDLDTSADEQVLIGAYLVSHFSAFDSQVALGGDESLDVANAIGARLYASTRRNVDRAIRRVEHSVRGSAEATSMSAVVQP